MSLTEDQRKYLLYASPCNEFLKTIKTLSEKEKKELLVDAKHQALSIGQLFREKLQYGDGPKAGMYAHDLAERALLLYDDPANFHELGEIMDCTAAILPHISTQMVKDNNISAPINGIIGLASDMVRPLLTKSSTIHYKEGSSQIILNIIGAIVCVAILLLFLFHPFFVSLFASGNIDGLFKGLGAIICIILLFSIGLAGAGIFLVVYALIMSTIEKIISLNILVKFIACIIPIALCIYLLYSAYQAFLSRSRYLRRIKDLSLYADDAEECLIFFEECLKKAERYNQWQKTKYYKDDIDAVIKYYKNAIKEIKSVLSKIPY